MFMVLCLIVVLAVQRLAVYSTLSRIASRLPQYANNRCGTDAELGRRISVLRHVPARKANAAAELPDESKDLENRGQVGIAAVGVARLAESGRGRRTFPIPFP